MTNALEIEADHSDLNALDRIFLCSLQRIYLTIVKANKGHESSSNDKLMDPKRSVGEPYGFIPSANRAVRKEICPIVRAIRGKLKNFLPKNEDVHRKFII